MLVAKAEPNVGLIKVGELFKATLPDPTKSLEIKPLLPSVNTALEAVKLFIIGCAVKVLIPVTFKVPPITPLPSILNLLPVCVVVELEI